MAYDPTLWDEPHTVGWVNLKLREGLALESPEVAAVFEAVDADPHTTFEVIDVHHFRFATDLAAKFFCEAVVAADLVEFVEPDVHAKPGLIPNDPGFPGNGGIGGVVQDYLNQMNFPNAWDVTTGSSQVIWAWIDTHFLVSHPDEIGKFAASSYDFLNNTSTLVFPPADTHGHAVRTSGVMANLNNGTGIAAAGGACLMMACQCAADDTSSDPGISITLAATALLTAINTPGCRGANMSFTTTTDLSTFRLAVASAIAAGMVLVGIGANNNDGTTVVYPAAYPSMLACGSVNASFARSSFSDFQSFINIAAYGDNPFLTTNYDGGYISNAIGCSLAAGLISAAGCLIFAKNFGLSGNDARQLLLDPANSTATMGFTNSTVMVPDAGKVLNAVAGSNLFWTMYDNFRLNQYTGSALNLDAGGAHVHCALITFATAPNTATDTTWPGSYVEVVGGGYATGGIDISAGQSCTLAAGEIIFTSTTPIVWPSSGTGFSNAYYPILYDSVTNKLIAWGGFGANYGNNFNNLALTLAAAGIALNP